MKILKKILKKLRQSRVNYQVQNKINDIIKNYHLKYLYNTYNNQL